MCTVFRRFVFPLRSSLVPKWKLFRPAPILSRLSLQLYGLPFRRVSLVSVASVSLHGGTGPRRSSRWFRHGGDEIYLCSQRIARNRKHRHSTQHSAQQRPIFLNKSAAPKRTRIEYPWISALDTQPCCARALCWAAGGFLNPKVLNRNLALLKLISFISISGNLLKMPT